VIRRSREILIAKRCRWRGGEAMRLRQVDDNRVQDADGEGDPRGSVRGHLPVLPFVVVTFVWTWSWWWMAAASGLSVTGGGPGSLLYLLGVLGPTVGAAWIVRHGGRAYRREFLRRIWDPRGIPARWWLALLAVAGGPAVGAWALTTLTGAGGTVPDHSVGAVMAAAAVALVAGLAEEPGWRGAASDAWQARTRPASAAIAIGVLWAIWHLPLSFIEGHYYHDLGFGSVRFWLAYLILAQMGVLFVWLANGTGGSILIAILAHTGLNITFGLVPSSTTRDVVAFIVVTAAATTVVAGTRGQLRFAPTASSVSSR
jgi:uncharacterized protein